MKEDKYTEAQKAYYIRLSNGRVEAIRKVVAEFFNTVPEVLATDTRKREITHIRYLAIGYSKQFAGNVTLKGIGLFFGCRHYSTIMHDIEKAEDVKINLPRVDIRKLESKIKEELQNLNELRNQKEAA